MNDNVDSNHGPRSIAVVGGGTAGFIAALTLKQYHPSVDITVIESTDIPVIGVGESTTSEIVPFLHVLLGIDVHEFYREVKPTWKLGIRFLWGKPDEYYFNYPFDRGGILESVVYDGHIRNCTALSILMSEGKAPVFALAGDAPASALPYLPFGYHLDNRRFVAFLHRLAIARGIHHLDRRITGARRHASGEGLSALHTSDGEELTYDFYVDCTGFRSLLLEQTLGSPFQSYSASLWTDSAVVGNAPHGGKLKPYTTAETMEYGWCWTIPQVEEDHLGYVFASNCINVDQATDEMRRAHPDVSDFWTVKFRSGRHREFCIGNVAALGNAYGFVEPLESTSIFVLCRASLWLASQLTTLEPPGGGREFLNQSVGALWDYIRWFLSVHYRFNNRLDSSFWRACRKDADVSGCESILQEYRRQAPLSSKTGMAPPLQGRVFDAFGYDVMLMGQQVPAALQSPAESEAEYRERLRHYGTLASVSMPHADALRTVHAEGSLLQDLFAGESWVTAFAQQLRTLGRVN